MPLPTVPSSHRIEIMPPSKRKSSKAKLPPPDFAKKKSRLGPKQRAGNLTNTSFKSRQIYVPNQTRPTTTPTSKPGLPLPELLKRNSHYNAQTRLSSFNALTKALSDPNAAAHAEAKLHLSAVLASGLDGVPDDHPGVRRAAADVVVECVGLLPQVGAFGRGIAAAVLAMVSHIRIDVRVAGARLVTRLMEVDGVWGGMLFAGMGNPLIGLGECLGGVDKGGGKVAVLEAIAAVSRMGEEKKEKAASAGRFFYHRDRRTSVGIKGLVERLSQKEAAGLLVRVGYLVCECLPMCEAKRDRERSSLVVAAVKAMREVACDWSLTEEGVGVVKRVVSEWGGRGIAEADVGIASVAVKADIGEEVLREVVGQKGVDGVVQQYVERSGEGGIGRAWIRIWMEKGRRGEWEYCGKTAGVLKVVLDAVDRQERDEWLGTVAKIGWGCCEHGTGEDVFKVAVDWLRKGVGGNAQQAVGREIVEGISNGGWRELNEETGALVGAGLFYGEVGLEDAVLEAMIGSCVSGECGDGLEMAVRARLSEGGVSRQEEIATRAALHVLEEIKRERAGEQDGVGRRVSEMRD
eukprot:GFKZ01009068.1.p1 GENE.GFKZ01009068.1~~GFKZ01009068.1.p1  ORF type:complete len:576 (-),score=103.20 GFKZ01009068.1:360-2087(-)